MRETGISLTGEVSSKADQTIIAQNNMMSFVPSISSGYRRFGLLIIKPIGLNPYIFRIFEKEGNSSSSSNTSPFTRTNGNKTI